MTGGVRIRAETAADVAAVRRVLSAAFPTEVEADLVDALRGTTDPWLSLVAEDDEREVNGHILFTPVEVHSPTGVSSALGLGPMAVHPLHQRRGVGSALVRAGLSACRDVGALVVVVLGHPAYYPRFGFRPAWDFGLYYRAPGRNPACMVLELEPGALRGRSGEVRYHPAFDERSSRP